MIQLLKLLSERDDARLGVVDRSETLRKPFPIFVLYCCDIPETKAIFTVLHEPVFSRLCVRCLSTATNI